MRRHGSAIGTIPSSRASFTLPSATRVRRLLQRCPRQCKHLSYWSDYRLDIVASSLSVTDHRCSSVKTPTSYPPSLYTNTMATASSFPSEYYGADNPIVSPTWVSFGYESVDLEVRDSDSHDTLSPEPLSSTAGPTETPSSISSMTHTPVPTTMTAPSNTTASTYSAPTPSVIPQFVKFEERRLKGLHDTAICNLMKRVPDLTFKQVFDKWGKAVTVTLNEDDGPNALKNKMKRSPFYTTGGGAALEKRQSRYVPSEVNETCFCQWTSETFD